ARAMFENDRGESHNDRVRAFSEEKKALIAERVGLSAIKYADLSHNLASDYVFNWDKMLAMEGNTGPYMLYAYARIMSIGRKGGVDFNRLSFDGKLLLLQAKEIELAKELCRFGDVVREVALQLRPNLLTDYLYTLSKTFSGFYDKNTGVSVLEAETEELRNSRLCLCGLTAKTLKQGLYLLGIEVVEEM
ncbi:MAG TPA: arginine--tRNA ligase, partial [bacterium]|nr:arginine--tRNA ligase [bacterium]